MRRTSETSNFILGRWALLSRGLIRKQFFSSIFLFAALFDCKKTFTFFSFCNFYQIVIQSSQATINCSGVGIIRIGLCAVVEKKISNNSYVFSKNKIIFLFQFPLIKNCLPHYHKLVNLHFRNQRKVFHLELPNITLLNRVRMCAPIFHPKKSIQKLVKIQKQKIRYFSIPNFHCSISARSEKSIINDRNARGIQVRKLRLNIFTLLQSHHGQLESL